MEHHDLQDLMARYLAGKASPEEIGFLLRQFNKKEGEAVLRSVIRELEASYEISEYKSQARANALQDSYDLIKSQINSESEEDKTLPRPRHILLKISVAAAITLLVASSVFMLTNNNYKGITEKTASTRHNDIAPGGNKAVLTLSNGTKIVLDSIQTGMVSRQGNTKIIKLNNGQLAYNRQLGNNRKSTVHYNTITTPRGGQYQVILSDGTKVWLNAASSIYFPSEFRGRTREVRVTGEVYFEVEENAKRPFIVSVDDMTVQVLGTHFNVMAYDDEPATKVTLTEGSIKVTDGNKAVLLEPGDQVQVDKADRLKKVKDVDLQGIIAWKNNQFCFNDDDIKTVMRRLSRWYDADVVIKGKIPQHFGGYISRDINLSKVLEALEATSHLQFIVQDSTIIVSP